MRASRPPMLITTVGGLALLATVLFGLALRLVDPLSTPVIPAEDPFNHMALIREHIRSGTVSVFDENTELYPPGMHALLAAVWAYTGADLYQIIRLGPVFFGTLGILGMGILLWRHVGPVGAFVGSLAYAVAPEVVFRTTMMSPTAVDLALAPFFLFAILEIASGRIRWLPVAGLMSLFFVFSHPWLLGILAIASGFFVVVTLIAPGSKSHAPPTSALGLSVVIAVIGGGLGIAMTGCSGYCGPGMSAFLPSFMNTLWAASLVIALSVAPAFLVAAYPRTVQRLLEIRPRRPLPLWLKLPVSALIAAAIIMITLPAAQQGMPKDVDLPRMIGWPILLIAGFGLVALPFMASRLSYLGTGIILGTYPMVIYNVFGSPFWPHRTVVFLALGATILVGVTAAAVTRWAVAALSSAQDTLSGRLKGGLFSRREGRLSTFIVVPVFVIVASMGGAVYSETPEIYPGGWYRLYPECEMEALQEMSDKLMEDPDALMITGSWQSRLVLAGLTDDPGRIWFEPTFYTDYDRREDILALQAKKGAPVHILLDRHLEDHITPSHLSFLDEDRWQFYDAWCAGMGKEEARIEMHTTGGAPL